MKVAFVQYDIEWESPQANKDKVLSMLASGDDGIDLVVLPEMFTTGFSMKTLENYEETDGDTFKWMRKVAADYGCVVTGSVIIKSGEDFYNRLFWVRPDGTSCHYDKKHLFTLAKENHHFKAGSKRQIFELAVDGIKWRICPLVCYDLRFPVWSRNTEDYDLLLYVANFPEKRRFAWSQLLIARAIENQSYTIGVNRIGIDGTGIPYSGDSVALDYSGREMVSSRSKEGIFYVNLSKEKQVAYRRAYNFLADRDHFEFTEDA